MTQILLIPPVPSIPTQLKVKIPWKVCPPGLGLLRFWRMPRWDDWPMKSRPPVIALPKRTLQKMRMSQTLFIAPFDSNSDHIQFALVILPHVFYRFGSIGKKPNASSILASRLAVLWAMAMCPRLSLFRTSTSTRSRKPRRLWMGAFPSLTRRIPMKNPRNPRRARKPRKKQPKGRENLRVRKWTHHGNMVKFDLLS